jgi:hypothetical protein
MCLFVVSSLFFLGWTIREVVVFFEALFYVCFSSFVFQIFCIGPETRRIQKTANKTGAYSAAQTVVIKIT